MNNCFFNSNLKPVIKWLVRAVTPCLYSLLYVGEEETLNLADQVLDAADKQDFKSDEETTSEDEAADGALDSELESE